MPAPPELPDLYEASIAELQDGLGSGLFTSVDLTRAYLARIDEVNTKLHCIVTCNPHALEAAAEADEERTADSTAVLRKPLLGIPIAIKDNISTRAADGMATTASSCALQGAIAREDAPCVRRLREAGAIILAKTSLSEWANFRTRGFPSGWGGMHGQCFGAYAEKANPVGSSSGSAVAASIGLCAAALSVHLRTSRLWTDALLQGNRDKRLVRCLDFNQCSS
jgi:amidase